MTLAADPRVDVRAFIQANLPLLSLPDFPDMRLHRAQPNSGLGRLGASGAPYWAYPWPGGLALAHHIRARPAIVAGRRVLDLGAGGGLVAIAAAKAGARQVTAAETDPCGRVALDLNAAANDVALDIVANDLTGSPPPPVDLVLVGDLFYARALAVRVTAFLDRCLDAGAEVLVGDIGRAFLPTARLRRIADYLVTDVGAAPSRAPVPGGVFVFEKEA